MIFSSYLQYFLSKTLNLLVFLCNYLILFLYLHHQSLINTFQILICGLVNACQAVNVVPLSPDNSFLNLDLSFCIFEANHVRLVVAPDIIKLLLVLTTETIHTFLYIFDTICHEGQF